MNYWIKGSGPAILFLHGLPTSGRLWDFVVPLLQSDFTCVLVDLPGFGESPLLPEGSLDPDRYSHTLEELRKQLAIPSWHIVGHDAGSTIAVHYAVLYSEHLNRLVLCSPPIFPELKVPWFFRLFRARVFGDLIAPIGVPIFWRFFFPVALYQLKQARTDIIEAFRRPFRGFAGSRRFLNLLRWGEPTKVLAKTAQMLPSITAQTLILQGNADAAVPVSFATRAAESIPDSEMHILECSHFLPLICADAMSEKIVPFFRE